jgi:hypothetical protein
VNSRVLESRRSVWILLLVTALLYSPVIWMGFVWDDFPLIVDNPQVQDLSLIGHWFRSDLWAGLEGVTFESGSQSGFYRPIVLMSFALDHALWGGSPVGFHLQSLFWHLLAVGILSALLRALFSADVALVGASVYALHPALSEGVVWISARNDPMGVALLLGAVLCVLPRRASVPRLVGGGVLFLAALLCKESSLVGFALLAVLDWGRWGRLRGAFRYASFGVALLGCWALRSWAQIQSADLHLAAGVDLLRSQGEQVLSVYFRLLLWPFDLSVGRSLDYLREPSGLTLFGLVVGGGACALLVDRGRRWAVAGLGFAVLAFIPALVAIAAKGQLGERYLTLPMVGIVLAICGALSNAQLGARKMGLGLAVFSVVSAWGIQQRLPDWQNEQVLWVAATKSDPSPYTWANLGHMHNREAIRNRERGQDSEAGFERAMALFERSFADPAPYLDNCVILIRAPMRRRQFQRGLRNAQIGTAAGCTEHPSQGASFLGIHGVLLALNGEWGAASERLDLVANDPNGRGDVLRAAVLLARWPTLERPSVLQPYCAMRPRDVADAEVFDASVLRLLLAGGQPRPQGFDAQGLAVAACVSPGRMF